MKLCMYKIIHGHFDFPNLPVFFRENPHGLRYLNVFTVSGFGARTDSSMHSYFPSMAKIQNILPLELVITPYIFCASSYIIYMSRWIC